MSVISPLQVDLRDPDHQVEIEFVNFDDFDRMCGDCAGLDFEPHAYLDLKRAASHVSSQVERHGKNVYFGTFYDPMVETEDKQYNLIESERLLRLQVKDFIDWLKGQGVI